MNSFIKRIKTVFEEYLFTVKCPYCKKIINRNEYACEECKKEFPDIPIVRRSVGGFKCVCPFKYSGIFKKAISNFKFCGCGSFAKQLSFPLVQSILSEYSDVKIDIITAVPMHKSSLKKRGYNQAELLARECAEILGLPYVQTLEKFRKNSAQHNIKAKERAKNVKGVYRIKDTKNVNNKTILIIDDIITTGNTLGECGKILMHSGCKKVICAAICSA